jgi:hypothetical protein
MATEIELFESPDLTPLDFLFVRLNEERGVEKRNFSPAFWVLLPA